MATSRTNVTDKQQSVLEQATFEDGVPVFQNDKTRVIVDGRGGAQKVSHESGNRHSNAGVVMPVADKYNKFTESTIGKA